MCSCCTRTGEKGEEGVKGEGEGDRERGGE